jgi:putative transposase
MARHKRIREPGLLRHVMSRGNGRMQIFLDDGDYRKFLFVLSDILEVYEVECWDFCVMPNHYHLVVRNRKANLSEALQHLNGEYALWWNATHRKIGHVFQGRFKDQIVQREGYLLSLIRYVALNPVRANLVKLPEAWRWSSYRCTAGLHPNPGFVASDDVLRQFGDADVDVLRQRYVRHVLSRSDDDDAQFDRFRSKERVLGDRAFKLAISGDSEGALQDCQLQLPARDVGVSGC